MFPAKTRSLTKILSAVATLGLLVPTAHAAEPRVALREAVSPQPRLRAAHLLGRLDANTSLRAGLTLPLRNQAALTDLLRRQYTPGDPLYHQFLTPAQFTAQFGPTAADYAAVTAYARAQGLTITATSPGRTLLSVAGPAAKIEAAFGVQMGRYRLPNGSVVFSNSAAPSLPRSVAVRVAGVAGLSNIARMRPQFRRLHSDLQFPASRSHAPVPITGGSGGIGSGPLGGLSPNDVKYAYGLSSITPLYGTAIAAPAGALTGAGQNIGLFELDGYVLGDITKYVSQFSLPTPLTGTTASVTTLPVGTSMGLPVNIEGRTEVTLDIDMILALAPAATGVYVYEDDQGGAAVTGTTTVTTGDPIAPLTIFTRMANDLNPDGSNKPLVSVISCSWGINESAEDPVIYNGENALFQQMAAQGQSLFCSSGDNAAYDAYEQITTGSVIISTGLTSPEVDNPASQPFATGVGGTTLSYLKPSTNATTGAVTTGAYTGETVWSAGTPSVSPEGSGGGISSLWAKPAYQTGVGTSPIRREVPDVSLNADPNTGYSIFIGSTNATGVAGTTADTASVAEVVGGTSAAAPLWAAYTALINEQRTLNGLGSIGFLNPLLYPISGGSNYAADFHDIVTGSNLFYQAGPGYDDASGLGSFQGAPLLAALSLNVNQGAGTAVLTGSVTDNSATPVPIAGATVTAVVSSTGTVAATATTDTTGAFSLTVPTGLALRVTVDTGTITAPASDFSSTPQTVTVPATGTPMPLVFVLTPAQAFPAGIQMISAPYDYTGLGDFAAVFGLTPAQAQRSPRLIQYAPALSSYVFYPAPPADTLRLGQGYWVQFPSANYLHLTGNLASTASAFSIPLQPGWNQIGDPFPLAAPLSGISVVNSTGATVGLLPASPTVVAPTLFAFPVGASAYTALNPASDSLIPYAGYWVFAFQSCSLSVPVPAGSPPPAPTTPAPTTPVP